MGYPLSKAKDPVRKARLRPGEYQPLVVSIEEASGFSPGDAVTITYELERAGNKWSLVSYHPPHVAEWLLVRIVAINYRLRNFINYQVLTRQFHTVI